MEKININRLRQDDIIKLQSGTLLTVEDVWSAGNIYQVSSNGKIYSFSIDGKNLENGDNILEINWVEQPDDDVVQYIPKVTVDLLPILNVNGEDMFIYRLLDLDNLEIKEPQTLKARYKHVIIKTLVKKKGRDIEIVGEKKIICESEEECKKKLEEIEGRLNPIEGELDESSIKSMFEHD